MLLFEEWGKREYPSPPLLREEQGIEPTATSTHACTYVVDTGKWTRVSLVGGQASPLRQACSSPSFPIMGFCTRFIYFLSMTCFTFFRWKITRWMKMKTDALNAMYTLYNRTLQRYRGRTAMQCLWLDPNKGEVVVNDCHCSVDMFVLKGTGNTAA